MELTITEILSRSIQGATRPFLCRGEDDLLYYARGADITQVSKLFQRVLESKTMRMDQVCEFAVVRFMPYRETGEFVNVGVALFCRSAEHLAVRLEEKSQRIADFFPELDLNVFRNGRDQFFEEVLRVKRLIEGNDQGLSSDQKAEIFKELVRPRESVFRFGELGTLVTSDPAEKLAEIFERYVHRNFILAKEHAGGVEKLAKSRRAPILAPLTAE